MLTDERRNNILIYDKSGKLLDSWTLNLSTAHGLTIHDEGGEEFLYITDTSTGRVIKSDLNGNIILELNDPRQTGAYGINDRYAPTEKILGPPEIFMWQMVMVLNTSLDLVLKESL
jgi:peptidylamidoglycolate lyase